MDAAPAPAPRARGGAASVAHIAFKRVRWAATDVAAWLRREPHVPRPPRALVKGVGGGSFRGVGEEFLGLFRGLGGLRPDARVLDVGCGCGRMATPLARWMRGGTYDGFDVDERAVEWCRREITPRYPCFRFAVADVRNRHYRPRGTGDAATWSFPYPDASFDFVFLTSVFTHMLPPEQERYVSEIARVLAPGGTCFATFFLWNDEVASRIGSAPGGLRFGFAHDGYRAAHEENHEAALAIPEAEMRARFARHGLAVAEPVHFGLWCRLSGPTLQDVVVARKA